MLKNSTLLGIVYGVLFFGIILALIFSKVSSEAEDFFSYPTLPINFSGEEVPISGDNFFVKERFDKEYLQTSENLYQFYLYVKRYPVYIPYIEEQLRENNIPDDFKYLAIAESALRDDIVSSAGAAGIWQFMPETGREYDLVVNEFVDERYYFEKATQAAIEYLQNAYERFGNWTLVAAAYNRGPAGIAYDMESQNVDNYYDLYLNEETSRYIFRILAIKYMIEAYFRNEETINALIGGVHSIPDTETITVGAIEDLSLWSSENGYRYKDIKILNRWILGSSLPEGEWQIKVLTN